MPNAVEVVKKAAMEAVEASKPVNLLFGQVISAAPLKIQADQKAIYTEKMLVLTRSVTDYEADVTVSFQTEEEEGHRHLVKEKKKMKIHHSLVPGDWVVLARMQQGKKFVVLDRIQPNPELTGEWL